MGRHCARNNCPFCGWHYTDLELLHHGSTGQLLGYRVRCCGCGALGPTGANKSLATKLWNKRSEFLDRHGNPVAQVPIDVPSLLRKQAG